ncbi:MAG: hypothetical protein V9G12_24720 [Microthrixaceae bacterium]
MSEPTAPAGSDWRPLTRPPRRERTVTPFSRLARTHALGMGGEAMLAIGLAGSLFFKVDPAEGRERVLLGLLLTMAPFAVVAPLLGPLIDRVWGGHRAVIVASMALRSFVVFGMVSAAANGSLLLFPEAFVMLVLGKTYQVAKAAVVPAVVGDDDALVEANSKLQVLGGVAGVALAAPGALFALIGPGWVIGLCAVVFAVATVSAVSIPGERVADRPVTSAERVELRSGEILLAASSMAVLRAVVGFTTFLLAFALRVGTPQPEAERMARRIAAHLPVKGVEVLAPDGGYPKWWFGVVVFMGVVGGLVGASIAPRLRPFAREEHILLGALGVVGFAGLCAAIWSGPGGMSLLVALSAAAAKQAFDALVQRDAPDADLGRSFARFEARFQLFWVVGAVIPTALAVPVGLGAVGVVMIVVLAIISSRVGGFVQLSLSGKSGKSGISRSWRSSSPES